MSISNLVFQSPFFWFFFSAVFLGAAMSRSTRRLAAKRPRDQAFSCKWSVVSLCIAAAVVLATLGVFVPGPEKVRDIRLLYFFLATALLFFFAFRFRIALGLPLFSVIILAAVLLVLFFRSLIAFTGETEIARIKVLSAREDRMKLEVIPTEREPLILPLKGQYFSPIVKVIIFDDIYAFLGYKTWYRFVGMTSFRIERDEAGIRFRQEDTDHYFDHPTGVSELLYDYFERYENKIPGVKTVQVEIDLKRVHESAGTKETSIENYSVRIQNDGGVQIIRLD